MISFLPSLFSSVLAARDRNVATLYANIFNADQLSEEQKTYLAHEANLHKGGKSQFEYSF
jgi:hypothetical protein